MAEVDASLLLEPFRRREDRLSRLEDAQTSILRRLNSTSSLPAAVHANGAAQHVTLTEINLRLDRIERRLDLREEA